MATSPAPPALVVPGGWRIEGLPGTVREAGPSAERRLLEFFTAEISNPNTRLAYAAAAGRFFRWCETRNLALREITPFAVATYIEEMQDRYALPTVKQHLSALRALLDYLVSARKPLYRSFPVTIHHTFRASCSPISSRKMPAIGLGGVIGGGPAPIFGTRP